MSKTYWESVNKCLADRNHDRDVEIPTDGGYDLVPPIFILSPPRGGSTLFQQILISALELGYVSNIMAHFWLSPDVGARLQQRFMTGDFCSNFESEYGNSFGPLEPHEWGWFWHHWLALNGTDHYCRNPVDWQGLRRTLDQIQQIFERPIIFDNVYVCSNLVEIEKRIGPILVINLTRSPWHICNSVLNARVSRYGDISAFYGPVPLMWDASDKALDPVEQVVKQTRLLLDEIDTAAAAIPADRVLTVDYTDYHARPGEIVEEVRRFVNKHGGDIGPAGRSFEPFEDRNLTARSLPGIRDSLDTVFADYFPGLAIPART